MHDLPDLPPKDRVLPHAFLHQMANNAKRHLKGALRGAIAGWIPEKAPALFCEGAANAVYAAGVLAENTSPFRDTGLSQDQALAAPFHFHVEHLAHTEDNTYPIDLVRSETDAVKAAGRELDGVMWDEMPARGSETISLSVRQAE